MPASKSPAYVIVNDDEDATPGFLDGAALPRGVVRSRTFLEAAILVRVGPACAERWVIVSMYANVCDAERVAESMPTQVDGRRSRVAFMDPA